MKLRTYVPLSLLKVSNATCEFIKLDETLLQFAFFPIFVSNNFIVEFISSVWKDQIALN